MNNLLIRRKLIAFVTFVGGIYFFLEFILPEYVGGYKFGRYNDKISNGIILVSLMAIGLGIINLVMIHGRNIIQTRASWANSLALLVGLVVVMGIESVDFLNSEQQAREVAEISVLNKFVSKVADDYKKEHIPPVPRIEKLQESLRSLRSKFEMPASFLFLQALSGDKVELAGHLREVLSAAEEQTTLVVRAYQQQTGLDPANEILSARLAAVETAAQEVSRYNYQLTASKRASHFVYDGLLTPLGSAMFSLLAFYLASAAYRAFRIRSLEATLMMTAALVVMLGQIPHGPLYISKWLPDIRLWLLECVSNPSFRAIFFGSAIAGLSMAVRTWFSLERSPLSVDESTNDGGAS